MNSGPPNLTFSLRFAHHVFFFTALLILNTFSVDWGFSCINPLVTCAVFLPLFLVASPSFPTRHVEDLSIAATFHLFIDNSF